MVRGNRVGARKKKRQVRARAASLVSRARAAEPAVGTSVLRKEGMGKVTGGVRYVDDLTFPGMLYGTTVRSAISRGAIASVRLGFDPAGFTVVDHRDIPGKNVIALIEPDQPALAVREVRHAEEPLLLLAHASREALLAARVHVDYAPADPNFDPRRSGRVFKEIGIDKGDLAAGFAAADLIVEGEYTTGAQEQLYIEPQGVIAVPAPDGDGGGITVYGSLQCPYYVRKALAALLALPPEKVRVVQCETGGGFGGKEEYPSMLAAHAALLARKSGRPVKMVYDRAEDMAATTKRHPSIVRHRTGVARDGRLTAIDVDVLFDGGAYVTLSPVVLSRGVLHATGAYSCDAVRVRGRAVETNVPPHGAFRGFGAPQTLFAAEVHMERIAEALSMDPVALREKNALRAGDTTATGQVLGKDTAALDVLAEAVRRSDFVRTRKRLGPGASAGIGLSLFFHGSGFTGDGEVQLSSRAALELTSRGARIRVGSTEIGQGTRTMHSQIVADALGVPYDAIEVAEVDTAAVPDSGPTVASRTCMVVGKLLERCAREMKARLGGRSHAEYLAEVGPLLVEKQYEKPADIEWDQERYRGAAYGAYAWGANVAELAVDRDTYEARPARLTTVIDVGKAIHPTLVRGQIEGGVAQALGWALLEDVVWKGGRMQNAQLTNYIVPTSLDLPPLDVAILERPYANGPFGAKGVGEAPMDGPAPAVANALRHAGYDVRDLPATPERILRCGSR